MTNGTTPAGWYQDPTGQGDARYWNGVSWTQSVDQSGVRVNVPIDPTQAQVPPVPGTQMQLPAPAPAPTNQTVVQTSSKSPIAAIVGGIVVLVVLVFVVVLISSGSDSSDESPTPGTDSPPATQPAAPATDAPADG